MSYARFRETNALTTKSKQLDTTCSSCAARGVVTTLVGPAAIVGRYDSMSDIVTPGFHRRSAAGEIIISPMTKVSIEHSASGDYSMTKRKVNTSFGCTVAPQCWEIKDYRGPWGHWLLTGSPVGGSVLSQSSALSQSEIDSANSAAATSAWAGTSHHSADVLQDLAEIRQLLNMVRDPLQTGHRLMDRILSKGRRPSTSGIKGAVGAAYDVYSYASSMWLQYRYGIRPLVSSIGGIIKELEKFERPYRNTSRGSYSVFASRVDTGQFTNNASINDYVYNYGDSYKVSTGIIIDEIVGMAKGLGVDASGMLALPWELVPYSFVADWFANVNDFIRAAVPFMTQRPVGTWIKTVRTQTTTFQIVNSVAATPSQFLLLRPANELRSSTWITTTRKPGIPGPSLTFKPQSISSVLSDARLIDSLTLLTQKMDRVFRG